MSGPVPLAYWKRSDAGTDNNSFKLPAFGLYWVLCFSFIPTSRSTLHTLWSLHNLIDLYEAWNKPEKAKEWRSKLAKAEAVQE